MINSLSTAGDIAAIAAPFTVAVIDTWLKPKLAEFFKSQSASKALLEHKLSTRFEEYLNRSFERHAYINTVVFQNQRQLLEDLYIPLTVEAKAKQLKLKINGYPRNFIPGVKRVLVVDTAGMGKSTILKYLFLQCIKENAGIPVFIELRQLTSGRNLVDVLFDELNAIDEEVDRNIILKFLRRGDFVFFLDGYDEIPLDERATVTRELQRFIAKASNSEFILSSRHESSLASFADFQQFTIRPLEIKEAFNLIRKYGGGGDVAKQLIERLQGETLRNIHEFLANPLLVSLLYKCYEYKPTIPLRKHIFYRQVYDALYESHDLTKGGAYIRQKHSGLDIDDFHRVLRVLGYITFTDGKVEFGKDELLSHIGTAARQCPGITLKPADFIRDLTTTVPLFIVDGDQIRWSHKSIQEYFAAHFICLDAKANQGTILTKLVESNERLRYLNVLDLCYDIDYKTFRRVLLLPMALRFVEHCKKAGPFEAKGAIKAEDVVLRHSLRFARRYVLFPSSYAQESDVPRGLFDRIVSYVEESRIVEKDEVISSTSFWVGGGAVVVISQPDALLLHLLAARQDGLVKWLQPQEYTEALVPGSVIKGKAPVLLDDDVKGICNRGAAFSKVNRLLLDAISNGHTLDSDACSALIQEVEQESRRDEELLTLTDRL